MTNYPVENPEDNQRYQHLTAMPFTFAHYLPYQCYLCRAPCQTKAPCDQCQHWLLGLTTPRCPQCALALPSDGASCPQADQHGAIDATLVANDYGGLTAKLIRDLKYNKQLQALPTLQWLASALCDLQDEDQLYLPVPTHWRRRLQRGFDHIGLIYQARICSKATLKRHYRRPLEGLTRKDRYRQLKGSFYLTDGHLPRRITLLDDVTTTGATLNEIARLLKHHGVQTVDAIALCKTSR